MLNEMHAVSAYTLSLDDEPSHRARGPAQAPSIEPLPSEARGDRANVGPTFGSSIESDKPKHHSYLYSSSTFPLFRPFGNAS